ncbi:unnamed protein product [Musa textilis]
MLALLRICHIFKTVHLQELRRLHTCTFMSATSSRYLRIQFHSICVIPLHNHPGMTVFSKLLFGSMHIRSYDWVNVPQNSDEIVNSLHYQHPGLQLAKVKTDAIFTVPCKASVLYPEDGGNMHCFTARTSCAVLDVLGPPYSDPDQGRDCTYFNDLPFDIFSGDGKLAPDEAGVYAWLEERKKPGSWGI